MGVNELLRSIDVGAIRPIYGQNTDFILFGWIQAFQTHEDAFGTLSGYISRENILHLRCPIISIASDMYPLGLEIRVPPRFPDQDPQCKLIDIKTGNPFARGALPINNPSISQLDYQIDLKRLSAAGNLPLRSNPHNSGTPSLVQLLAAISNVVNDAFEVIIQQQYQIQNQNQNNNITAQQINRHVDPVSTTTNQSSPPTSSPTLNLNVQHQQPPPPPSSPPGANNNPASSPVVVGTHLGPPLTAPKEVHTAVAARVREFFEQREAALKTLGHLQGSQDTLQRLMKSLTDKKSTLNDAYREVTQMASLCDQVVQAKPPSALKCIDASDSLSSQGFALLAEIQACDDVMESLEKRLRTGGTKNTSDKRNPADSTSSTNNLNSANSFAFGTSHKDGTHVVSPLMAIEESPTTNYLRLVGNIARRQFMAKFLLRKVQGKRLASRSLQSLINRFPSLDPSVISAVLESNAYDAAATAQRLTEMTRV